MIGAKLLSVGFLSVGVFILMQVVLPIASFQFWQLGQKYNNSVLISPQTPTHGQILGVSVRNKDNFSLIFSTLKRETKPDYSVFRISIPKIKIDHAPVLVDSNDLSDSLAQLPASALPGEKGNLFISGHSALSQIFSLKEAYFAKLTDLKKGDQIEVFAAGMKYLYEVLDLKVVNPNDLSVINPPDDLGRYISLMTCVPPGLNFQRLIVLGKII